MGVLAPPWWSKSCVGRSQGQRRMPGTLSRGPALRVRELQTLRILYEEVGESRWRSSTCLPCAGERKRTPTGTPGQVRAWDRSGPRRGQGSLEMSEASWNPVRHQPGWAHRTQAGTDPEKQAGFGNNLAGPSATISGDWRLPWEPRGRQSALGRW